MTERQLMNVQQPLKAAEIDCDCLTIEEVADLQRTVEKRACALRTVEKRAYALRIKNFRQFLDDVLPNNDSSDEDWDKFYDSDWSISFGGKTVTIHNGAAVYNSMCDVLDECIDECL